MHKTRFQCQSCAEWQPIEDRHEGGLDCVEMCLKCWEQEGKDMLLETWDEHYPGIEFEGPGCFSCNSIDVELAARDTTDPRFGYCYDCCP